MLFAAGAISIGSPNSSHDHIRYELLAFEIIIDIGACGAILQKADDDFFVFIHLVNRLRDHDYPHFAN